MSTVSTQKRGKSAKSTKERAPKKEKAPPADSEPVAPAPTKGAGKRAPKTTPVVDVVPETTETAPRLAPTPDTLLESFDTLYASIDEEMKTVRSNKEAVPKQQVLKMLKDMNKTVKALKTTTARVMKNSQKKRTTRTANSNSGFLKPVAISGEMAEFTGWNPTEPKSRVEVTKYICDYIKQNNLQNPEDRRQIKPDAKLQKLLGYNPKKNTDPLRYYSLQTHLKRHFPSTN
jgi:upstream activation factor subunit UAF30